MSENDYIAEYIREKYPKLLGMDYTVWKMGRLMGDFLSRIADTLSGFDWKEVAKYANEHTEDPEE